MLTPFNTHLLFWRWDGNVDIVVFHETSNFTTFLTYDVAVVFEGYGHFLGNGNELLWKVRLQENRKLEGGGGEEREGVVKLHFSFRVQ